MGLLQGLLAQKPDYFAPGRTTRLRNPRMEDFAQWRDLRVASRAFLVPWEPAWQDDELLLSSFRRRMTHYAKLASDDLAYPFFIFDSSEEQLMGAITISNVRRGVAQMATLGYWTGEAFAHRGVMTDALAAILGFARDELRLNRMEAACLPANLPSLRLLEKSGFEREGFAKAYLKINGAWEDHVLWGRRIQGWNNHNQS
jgi:[ribosomal protein S5]-alanine N-acetyltransferase